MQLSTIILQFNKAFNASCNNIINSIKKRIMNSYALERRGFNTEFENINEFTFKTFPLPLLFDIIAVADVVIASPATLPFIVVAPIKFGAAILSSEN